MELIDRTKLEPHQIHDEDGWVEVVYMDDIREMPTIEAEPKHGRWEHEKRSCEHGWYDALVCTVCYKSAVDEYRYCPHCGADMRGEEK